MPNELEQHLAEKTAGLNADARRAVYARAREALQNEVRASAPFMPVTTVVARRRELENAIMAVERVAAKADPPRPRTPPVPKVETKPAEPPAPKVETKPAELPASKVEITPPEPPAPEVAAAAVAAVVEAAPVVIDREETREEEAQPVWSEESAQEYARYVRQMETHPSVEVRDVSLASYELLARALEDMSGQEPEREDGEPHEFTIAEEVAPPPRRPLLLYAGVLALVLCAVALAALLVGFGFERPSPAQTARPPAPSMPESQLIKGAGFQDAAKEALAHANALLARRDFTQAVAAFDDAIRLDPRNASALTGRATAHSRKGEYRAAVDDLDRALAIDPANTDALTSRCWTRAVLGQLEEALFDCNRSLAVRPGDANALDNRGFVLLRLGRLERAIADYDAALKVQPKMANALYGRGLARIGRGDRAGGMEDVAAARAVDPDIVAAFARYGVR